MGGWVVWWRGGACVGVSAGRNAVCYLSLSTSRVPVDERENEILFCFLYGARLAVYTHTHTLKTRPHRTHHTHAWGMTPHTRRAHAFKVGAVPFYEVSRKKKFSSRLLTFFMGAGTRKKGTRPGRWARRGRHARTSARTRRTGYWGESDARAHKKGG